MYNKVCHLLAVPPIHMTGYPYGSPAVLVLPGYWAFGSINVGKSKSKSKKTLFNDGQCKQYNISSHLKWVLVADKSMHMIIYNKIQIKMIP